MSDKPKSLLSRLKQRSKNQQEYGGRTKDEDAKISTRTCDNCGSPRSTNTGVTHCAYCGFAFVDKELTDGVFIKKKDNSK